MTAADTLDRGRESFGRRHVAEQIAARRPDRLDRTTLSI